jgi:hypothetical protein
MKIVNKRISELDRYKYLLEYQIKKGDSFEENQDAESDDVFSELTSVIDNNQDEDGSNEPEEEPIENKSDIDINTNDNNSFEDTSTDLFKIHSFKIEKLTNHINDVINIMDELNNKIDQNTMPIDDINNRVNQLDKQVDILTPPTPLESLDKMVSISGGQRLEDYWNEYFRKNGRDDIVQNIYYNDPQFNKNEKGVNQTIYRKPNVSDTEIKEIIKNA